MMHKQKGIITKFKIMCTIKETRLNVLVVAEQLKKFNTGNNTATPVLITLYKESKKNKWSVNAPFPAIICPTSDGQLAVANAVTGKKEVINPITCKTTPLGNLFEYKGHIYEAEYLNGIPRYHLKK